MAMKVLDAFLLVLIATISQVSAKDCIGKPGMKVLVNDPPEFVYRADWRKPKTVFADGMTCLGKNDNLLDHFQGKSTKYSKTKEAKSSHFVSTSSKEEKAIQWGKKLFEKYNPDKKKVIYLYKLRANENYYSVCETLMNAFHLKSDEIYKQLATAVGKYYSEWIACGGIRKEDVIDATEYYDGSDLTPGKIQANPNYKPPTNSRGNQHAYIQKENMVDNGKVPDALIQQCH